MAERQVQIVSKHRCGLPSRSDKSSPETSLRPLFEELITFYAHAVTSPHKLVVDLAENSFALQHLQCFAEWLSKQGMHLYALDLSLNRIYADVWEDILPSIHTLLQHVELLNLGGNHLPALLNIPTLQDVQRRKVAFIAPDHSFSRGPWLEEEGSAVLSGNLWVSKWRRYLHAEHNESVMGGSWAFWYNTWLLFKLTLNSFLFLSFLMGGWCRERW